MVPFPSAQIETVRLRAAKLDPLRARQRVERGLDRLDWSSLGLDPQAILLVRRLTLPLTPTTPRAAAPPWTARTHELLRTLVRQAARPAVEAVAAAAPAVCFANLRELLVTLGRDLVAGTVDRHWWWRGGVAIRDALGFAQRLLAEPELVPAVCSDLDQHHCLAPLLAKLPSDTLADLGRSVIRAHGINWDPTDTASLTPPAARPTSASPSASPAAASPDVARSPSGSLSNHSRPHTFNATPPAPWQGVLPDWSGHGLAAERELWGAVLVLLHRAPRLVREPAFRHSLAVWLDHHHSAHASTETNVVVSPPAGDLPRAGSVRPPSSGIATDLSDASLPVDSRVAKSGDGDTHAVAHGTAQRAPSPVAESAGPALVGDEPSDRRFAARSESTTLGGIFFLLNVALSLGLYGDFTQPQSDEPELSPWEWLDLIARARFWSADTAADPVWECLRRLAGRPTNSPPGAAYVPPPLWQMTDRWIAPFRSAESAREPLAAAPDPGASMNANPIVGTGPQPSPDPGISKWWWTSCAGRSGLYHPANFLVLEIQSEPATDNGEPPFPPVLEHAWRAWASPTCPRPVWRAPPDHWQPTTLCDGWIAPQVDYLSARLALALGVEADEAWNLLGHCRATVRDDGTRVDVRYALADHPFEIRRAGLDRDPGWIPAAGRRLHFHFD